MKRKVLQFINKHQLIEDNSTIVVGVSGGPDSVCLLHLLLGLQEERKIKIVVTHVDHMFRGKESEDDMEFVKKLCSKLNVLVETKQIDVSAYKQKNKVSAQVAARDCRYSFFKEVMLKHNATSLALGQHGDDQVETILMKISRGSSIPGYAGILPKRAFELGYVIRPLLSVGKEEVYRYLQENGIEYRTDPSNEKTVYTRNKIRHGVIPALRELYPGLHEKFQLFSEQMTEDNMLLEELTKKELNKVVESKREGNMVIHRNALLLLPNPLQRRAIQLILKYLYNNEVPLALSSIHIKDLQSILASEQPSGILNFPNGLIVEISYNKCIFSFESDKTVQPYCIEVDVPGKTILPTKDEIIFTVWTHYKRASTYEPNSAILDLSKVKLPLYIRTRKKGDRIKLKGMQGSKKVKSIFIDSKIPIKKREHWPIIVDAEDNLLWIPYLKRSSFEASEETKGPVLVITTKSSYSLGGK
ncbi:tRNA lysidine(34) synthetase TilS [Bacillus alkalisoli]|uniref:tRNA lysidine(34) synthetase TilS n=1 Tax=Bacillus alkalisoli TaxID=2011008 RepID=UPI000C2499C6|nr:tRNA lysidine(34) synthetase TilS [Bacillus alkalisoli]